MMSLPPPPMTFNWSVASACKMVTLGELPTTWMRPSTPVLMLIVSLPALPFTVIVSTWPSPVLEPIAPARSTTTPPSDSRCRRGR